MNLRSLSEEFLEIAYETWLEKDASDLWGGIGSDMHPTEAISGRAGRKTGQLLGSAPKLAPKPKYTMDMFRAAKGAIKTKMGSVIHPAADIAGLGVLAVPSVQNLRDPNATKREKSHAKYELAGLGTLAGVSAHSGYKEWKSGNKTPSMAQNVASNVKAKAPGVFNKIKSKFKNFARG